MFGIRHLINYRPWYEDPPKGGTGTGDDPAKNGNGEAKFTQADVDRLLGERASRAEEAERKKLFETLGVKDAEEAKAKLKAAKDAEDARLSELDKAKKDADEATAALAKAKADGDAALAKAQRKLMTAAIMAEAVKQNFDDAEVTSVTVAIANDPTLLALIEADKDADTFKGVDKAVKKVAELHPRWLKGTKPPNGTPSRKPSGTGKPEGEREIRSTTHF